MSLTVSPGTFQNAGYLIPEVWSPRLLFELYEQTTFADISNTDYEGEIRNVGDTVWIRGLPAITTSLVPKNAEIPVQIPETPRTQLTLDYRRMFNWFIDDEDRARSDINVMTEWTAHGGKKLGEDAERIDIYPNLIGQVGVTMQGNSAGRISGTYRLGALGATANHVGLTTGASGTANRRNVLDFIADLRVVCSENNVPEEDTYIVIPNWMSGMIKRSDLANANYSGDGTSIFRNGLLGELDRFKVYRSNQLPTAVDNSQRVHYVYFGHKKAVTAAMDLSWSRVIEDAKYAGKFAQSALVHGFKCIKGEAFGRAIVRPAISADT